MSDLELQRTAVRMLHDPAFLAAVYADPGRALAGLALSAAECAQLTRADVRAWQVDPHRRTRVLRAILDEYFATVATLWTTPSATAAASRALDAFFGSPHFHAAIRARRSLVLVFAAHLEEVVTGALGHGLLALEHAIARVRRAPAGQSASLAASLAAGMETSLVRAPRAVTLALPAGTLAAWEALAKDLRGRGDPIEVLLTGADGQGYRPPLPALATAADAPASEHVLVEQPRDRGLPGAADVSVSFVGDGLHALLAAADMATPREELTRRLMDEGLDAGEAAELLDELVRDALLVSP